ncbi:MAG TPA: lipoyl(octanoyl) transferase LipB [Chitinophagaceae bacterium]|nr:lipoyl(octanoyl) transferase LipB [Chitinophagaceae bacterium]
MKQQVKYSDLGLMEYQAAWNYQEELLKENVAKKTLVNNSLRESGATDLLSDTGMITQHHLLFVEHPPVFTLGKNGKMSNVLLEEDEMKKNGIGFFNTNRGGDITFHGPGQVVGYPILDLEKFYTDIGKYLRNIEEVIILTMSDYGLTGARSKGETGVWIDPDVPGRERKICAIGVRCSRWVTMHGFAFNVNTDLSYFNHIIPCGINNKQVTSLEKELGVKQDIEEVKSRIKRNFEKVFDAKLI